MRYLGILFSLLITNSASGLPSSCEVMVTLKSEFGRLAVSALERGHLSYAQLTNLEGVTSTPDNLPILKALKRTKVTSDAKQVRADLKRIEKWAAKNSDTREESREQTRVVFFPQQVDPRDRLLLPYWQNRELGYHFEVSNGKLEIFDSPTGYRKQLDSIPYVKFSKEMTEEFTSQNYGRDENGHLIFATHSVVTSNSRLLSMNLFVRNVTKKQTLWHSKAPSEWDLISPFFMYKGELSFIAFLNGGQGQLITLAKGIDNPVLTFPLNLPSSFVIQNRMDLYHDEEKRIYLAITGEPAFGLRVFRLENEVKP